MVVARADRIGAVLDELSHELELTFLGGEVQRHRVVAFVAHVRIGAAIEQELRSSARVCRPRRDAARYEAPCVRRREPRSLDDVGDLSSSCDSRVVAVARRLEQRLIAASRALAGVA